jgi:YcxB-like protein
MTLKFNITQEEYAEFTKHFHKKVLTGNSIVFAVIAVVLIAWNIFMLYNPLHFKRKRIVVMPDAYYHVLFFMILLCGIMWFTVKKSRKQTIKIDEPLVYLATQEMIIEEDNVQVKTTTSETTYLWEAFVKLEQTPHLFLLFMASNTALLIPKRAFENSQQQADFEALVKRKMPDSLN